MSFLILVGYMSSFVVAARLLYFSTQYHKPWITVNDDKFNIVMSLVLAVFGPLTIIAALIAFPSGGIIVRFRRPTK